MDSSNNTVAKRILASHRAVSEEEKELILLGMRVQREIDINWLSVGAEDDIHVRNHREDKFSEGENGGGWEEQVPLVLQHLQVVQETPVVDLISSDEGVTKRHEDSLELSEDMVLSSSDEGVTKRHEDSLELSEDLDLSSSDEEDEVDYSLEDEITVHTLQWFEENRREQHTLAKEVVKYMEEHPEQKNIVIKAEEKTGKREMVEIIALLTSEKKKNSYFTAFNAKSIDVQLEEIVCYGVKTVKCNRVEKMHERVEEIEDDSIVHVDELDYGSGKLQSLSPLIAAEDFTKIFYSATTHELEKEMRGTDFKLFTFAPHGNYRGSEWFLEQDLVQDSTDFVKGEEVEFTKQGEELINMLTDEKPVGIVRLTKRGVYKSVKELFMDKFGPSSDGHYEVDGMHYRFVDSKIQRIFNPAKIGEIAEKTLIFVNQCWRRSTELKGHEKICFMHDHRRIAQKSRSGVAYASLSQAVSRVKHYAPIGHKIRIYSDKKAFQVACGKFSEEGLKLYNRQGLRETNKLGSAYAN